jgi:hypothetical protein
MRKIILGTAAALVLTATAAANAEEITVRDHPNGSVTVQEHPGVAPAPRDNVIVRDRPLYNSAAPEVVIKDRAAPRRDEEKVIIKDR